VKPLVNLFRRSQSRHEPTPATGPGPRGRGWLGRVLELAGCEAAAPARGRHRAAPAGAPRHPRPAGHSYDRLVALYTEASTLRDCALVEIRVGEDALSYGDELRANQHFSYSRHYRLRAVEAESSIQGELERLRRERSDWERLSASALTRARQRLYGSPTLAARPQFD